MNLENSGAMTPNQIKNSLIDVLEKFKNKIAFAYIFGSAATNDLRPLSDVDIALYFRDHLKETYYELKLVIHGEICRALKRNDIDFR